MKFSIIIPVKAINEYVHENIGHIQQQTYTDWEAIILPNEQEPNPWAAHPNIQVISSGRVAPGRKRDLGAENANGDVLVFLDDDSFPTPNYLTRAFDAFTDPSIQAIGGPGITPISDGFFQLVGGGVFLSSLSGGNPERYTSVGKQRFVTDWPSVNLMARKEIFDSVGGFNTDLWPGEDTIFCSKLYNQDRTQILYLPDLIVYHHRRQGFLGHLKQVGAYGHQRGHLARLGDLNSLSAKYFLPSGLVIFLLSNIAASKHFVLDGFLLAGWTIYAFALLKALYDIKQHLPIKIALFSMLLILPTHISYGLGFMRGLTGSQPVVKLR